MAQKSDCKSKQKSTELNNVLNTLIQQGQQIFKAALEEVKEYLPPEDQIIGVLQGLAKEMAQVLEDLVKELDQLSEQSVEAVRQATQGASLGIDGQTKRLHDENSFKNSQEAALCIKEVMENSLRELGTMMEKIRPHADAASQRVKERVEASLKKMNSLGDQLRKETVAIGRPSG